ncbi:ABC transporter ATP-binding protein [Bradyrhizobium arachidis]|uniref:ABC transporter ATP-binding protein n=1 Tax=Bradyrhizobium TaxID=374 RepID=UPI00188CAF6A|nr:MULTISPECIES: ABC transporter ATP-binding protein [Bradyrhizobium]MDN4983975.1 ABC transporter ATP-binding protein [Bradyrhizobium sp. WYCCWR 13022]QOZ51845.1 peptide ABC transporter ATP-binding protein [Bradyrhizobium sp. CCBAU 53338]UVO39016.1 ABC transporter ATP-binding protein [Bradyrhizobium arachidis]
MLSVRDLTVSLGPEHAALDIVDGVSFGLAKGEILGLVGESGCGKSMTSLAVMGLLPQPGPRVRAGQVMLDGCDVTRLQPWQRVEAGHGRMAMIFQEPMTSLNPVRRIGDQIAEAVRVHEGISGAAALSRARELLELVRMPDPQMQLSAYPHQLSGGQRQRVMIAIALACRPQVLIADEPTTALDVTIQVQILGLLRELCNRLDMAILFITHDMGVIAQLADRVSVMYAGRIVETASVDGLFKRPAHHYTSGLMDCMPSRNPSARRLPTISGQPPAPGRLAAGCVFASRCVAVRDLCRTEAPSRAEVSQGHEVLCAFPLNGGGPS